MKINQCCSCLCLLCLDRVDRFKRPASWTDLDMYYIDGPELRQFLLLGISKASLFPSFPNKVEGPLELN